MHKQSFTDPYPSDWNGTFDVVHQKLGLAGAAQFPLSTVIGNLAKLCRPGGWVELVELGVTLSHPSNGPAVNDMLRLMREIFDIIGVSGSYSLKLKTLLQEAGLEPVEERRIECSVGKRAKPDLIQKSINGMCSAIHPLTAVAKCECTYEWQISAPC